MSELTRAQKRALNLLRQPRAYLCYSPANGIRRIQIEGQNERVDISEKTFAAIEPHLMIDDDNGRSGSNRAFFYVIKP